MGLLYRPLVQYWARLLNRSRPTPNRHHYTGTCGRVMISVNVTRQCHRHDCHLELARMWYWIRIPVLVRGPGSNNVSICGELGWTQRSIEHHSVFEHLRRRNTIGQPKWAFRKKSHCQSRSPFVSCVLFSQNENQRRFLSREPALRPLTKPIADCRHNYSLLLN